MREKRTQNEPKTNPIRTQTNPIKANLPEAQMNVSSLLTKDYENQRLSRLGENKANTNPIKPNFRKARMKLNFCSTKDYENQPRLRTPRYRKWRGGPGAMETLARLGHPPAGPGLPAQWEKTLAFIAEFGHTFSVQMCKELFNGR